jgi:uncharacterized damage-inducible protein DinB
MIHPMPWIERQFNFEMPASMFPGLVERVRGTPARVEDRIKSRSRETLIRRSGDGWSIQESVGHLLAVEELWHGRLDDYDAGLNKLRPADMENRRTYAANYNEAEIEDLLASFRDSRMRFIARVENLDETGATRTALHPRLNQPMRLMDLLLFIAEHDDHHLARISELMASLD